MFLFNYSCRFLLFIFFQWLVIVLTLVFVQRAKGQEFYELEDLLKAAEVGAAAAEAVAIATTTSAPFLESLAEVIEVIANETSAEEREPELEGSGSLALEEEEEMTTMETVSTNPPPVQPEDTRGPGFCTCMPCETDLKRTTLELKVRVFYFVLVKV